MTRIMHVLCVGATVILLASCGRPNPASVQVNELDGSRIVDLHRGDRLDIVLEGNPTTGFAWEQVDGDSAVVAPAGEPKFMPASSAVGAGGTVTIPYTALAAGRTRLQFAYRRPFEAGIPPLKTFEIEVIVT